jgi:hypothetical protein
MSDTTNSVWTETEVAIFLQPGGASPLNRLLTAGLDGQFVAIDGLTIAGSDIAPIWNYDPEQAKSFIPVATEASPPDDYDSFSMMFRVAKDAIPRALIGENKPFDVYMNYGECVDPTNPLSGWTGYVNVLSGCMLAGNIEGSGKGFDTDGVIENTVPVKATGGIYQVGSLILGGQDASHEVVDIVYGRRTGACVSGNPEIDDIYALINTTGAAAAKVRYSTDGGNSFADLAITGITATEPVKAIAVLGQYLVVVGEQTGGATLSGYWYTTIDQDTGVPDSAWTEVTTGFVANALATDITVVNSREAYISAQDGYIFKLTDVAAGVTVSLQGDAANVNITSIDSKRGVVAAIDATGQVITSVNNGAIWSYALTIPAATANVIGVVDTKRLYVGTSTGLLYYTENGGKTWTAVTFPGSGTGAINDILAITKNVIHLAHTASGQGQIVSTWMGGYEWTRTERRIYNLPSNDRINKLAAPQKGRTGIRVNHIAAAALNADGTTGTIIIGAAPIK